MPREVVRPEELRGWEGVRESPVWPDLTPHALWHMPWRYWAVLLAALLLGNRVPPIVKSVFGID